MTTSKEEAVDSLGLELYEGGYEPERERYTNEERTVAVAEDDDPWLVPSDICEETESVEKFHYDRREVWLYRCEGSETTTYIRSLLLHDAVGVADAGVHDDVLVHPEYDDHPVRIPLEGGWNVVVAPYMVKT